MPRQKCEHGKTKYYCKDCGGKGICEHGKQKSRCKECNGSEICEHDKRKAYCKNCNGNAYCEHGKQKSRCKDCDGSEICEHNKRKSACKECGGSAYCKHNKQKSTCKDCKGSSICEHNKRKDICKECGGTQICIHNKYKSYCKECGGSHICKSSWCETFANKKYEGYCLSCFIHIFPDRPNSRNYKTKEKATADYVLEQFPQVKYSWILDKKIQDGCSRKRPDLLLDLGYQVIIVEIDENQHQDYDCSCENKRLMLLSQDVGHRPLVFIRFNPDEYLTKDEKVTSCWGIDGRGVCTVKKRKKKEWETRLESLKTQIEYWLENKTEKTVEVIQLFYDSN
jgi:hypothetical protein